MILIHMAPSCFNMHSYRAICTHFGPSFISIFNMFPQKDGVLKMPSSGKTLTLQIALTCHSHDLLT